MVRRKKQVQQPQPVDPGVSDYPKQSVALTEREMGTITRYIKDRGWERISLFKRVVDENLNRLGLSVGETKPVDGLPDGSDQVSEGDLLAWPTKIEDWDNDAKKQLLTIAATINRRLA